MDPLVKNVKNTFKGYEFYVVEGPFRISVVSLIQYGGGTIRETLNQDTIKISRELNDVPSDIMNDKVLAIDFITDCLGKGFMIHPREYELCQGYKYTPIFASDFRNFYIEFLAERSEQYSLSESDGNNYDGESEVSNKTRKKKNKNKNKKKVKMTYDSDDQLITSIQLDSVVEDNEGKSKVSNKTSLGKRKDFTNYSNEKSITSKQQDIGFDVGVDKSEVSNQTSRSRPIDVIIISDSEEELTSSKQDSIVEDNARKSAASLFINQNNGSKTQCAPRKSEPFSKALEKEMHGSRGKKSVDMDVLSPITPKCITLATVVESPPKEVQDKSTNSKGVSPKSKWKETRGSKGQKSVDMDVSSPKHMTRAAVGNSALKVVEDKSTTNSKDVSPKYKWKETYGTKGKTTVDMDVSSPKYMTRAAVVKSAAKVGEDKLTTNSKDVSPKYKWEKTYGRKDKKSVDMDVSSPKCQSASKVVQDESTTNTKYVSPRSKGKTTVDVDVSSPKRMTRAAVVKPASKVVQDESTTHPKDVPPRSRRKDTDGTESEDEIGGASPQKKTRTTWKSSPASESTDSPGSTRSEAKDADGRSSSSDRDQDDSLRKRNLMCWLAIEGVPASEESKLTSSTHLPVDQSIQSIDFVSDGPDASPQNDPESGQSRHNNIDVVKLDNFCMPLISLKEPKLDVAFSSDMDLVSALCSKCKHHTVYSQLNPLYVVSDGPGQCLGCIQQGNKIELELAFRLVMEVGYSDRRLEVNIIGRSAQQLLGCKETEFLQDQIVRQRVLDMLRAALSNEVYIHGTTVVTKQKDSHCIFLTNPKFSKIG